MWDVFYSVASNAGTNFEAMIIFIAIFIGIIFYAKGFQIGITINMVVLGGIFIWFYSAGLNYVMPLILFLTHIVIMSLSLYAVGKVEARGGII